MMTVSLVNVTRNVTHCSFQVDTTDVEVIGQMYENVLEIAKKSRWKNPMFVFWEKKDFQLLKDTPLEEFIRIVTV